MAFSSLLGAGRRFRVVLGLLVLAALGYGAYRHWGSPTDTREHGPGPGGKRGGGPVPITPATVRQGDMPVRLEGLGSVLSLSTVTVRSRVEGQLMALHFKEGQMVKEGQLLAEIDPRPFQVQLTQALGQYAKDEALWQNAKQDLERYKTLASQDSIARQQLDTQAALVRQYEGVLKSDQGQVDSARLQLNYARITAPAAGRLGLRQVDVGNIVRAADSNGVVVITRLQPITVLFSLPEDRVPSVLKRLSAGEKLPVEAWDRERKNKLADGHLLTLDNQIDAATGTVKLKAEFANKDYALFPNQFVNARMLVEVRKDAALIPLSALQRGQQNNSFVYLIQDDNTVSIRPVTPGPSDGDTVLIEQGLKPGERVVADGADKLRAGAKIDIITPGSTKGSGRKGKGEGQKRGGE